jgi:hypothetical protein
MIIKQEEYLKNNALIWKTIAYNYIKLTITPGNEKKAATITAAFFPMLRSVFFIR